MRNIMFIDFQDYIDEKERKEDERYIHELIQRRYESQINSLLSTIDEKNEEINKLNEKIKELEVLLSYKRLL